MVANGWMRPGNTNAATDAEHSLAQLLLILPPDRIGLLRAGIGFHGEPSKVLKLTAEGRRRHFPEHFFDQVEVLKPPFRLSTA